MCGFYNWIIFDIDLVLLQCSNAESLQSAGEDTQQNNKISKKKAKTAEKGIRLLRILWINKLVSRTEMFSVLCLMFYSHLLTFGNYSLCSESESYKPSDLKQKWRNMVFETSLLEGHNDMICSVATDGTFAVTGRYDCKCVCSFMVMGLFGSFHVIMNCPSCVVVLHRTASCVICGHPPKHTSDRRSVSPVLPCEKLGHTDLHFIFDTVTLREQEK